VRALRWTDGLVAQVTDQQIMDAKARVDAAGIGCEPASAAAVAGAKKLIEAGVIGQGEKVLVILTGHLLKDLQATVDYHLEKLVGLTPAYANRPVAIEPTLEAVQEALEQHLTMGEGLPTEPISPRSGDLRRSEEALEGSL
jgi:threonine synthase